MRFQKQHDFKWKYFFGQILKQHDFKRKYFWIDFKRKYFWIDFKTTRFRIEIFWGIFQNHPKIFDLTEKCVTFEFILNFICWQKEVAKHIYFLCRVRQIYSWLTSHQAVMSSDRNFFLSLKFKQRLSQCQSQKQRISKPYLS